MHESLLFAAINASRSPNLGPWRLEDNGAYALVVADVLRDNVKVGEIWIGGDEPGGISGYTLPSLEGDCQPVDNVQITYDVQGQVLSPNYGSHGNVRGGRELGNDLVSLIQKVLDATKHEIVLTQFNLGTHGYDDSFEVTVLGKEGDYSARMDGERWEFFDHQGLQTTLTYADGMDAQDDFDKLTAKFFAAYANAWGALGIPSVLEEAATDALNAHSVRL